MRKKLVEKCLSEFRVHRISQNQNPDSVYITKQWPSDFDLNKNEAFKSIVPAELKDQIKLNQGTSINNFIEQHDVKK